MARSYHTIFIDLYLYRDIICYPIKVANTNDDNIVNNVSNDARNVTFTRWSIVKWLRSNHSIYVTRYSEHPLDSNYSELLSIQNTIKRNLDRLVEIELLQVVGEEKIQTGTGMTPIYKHTIFGRLLAGLMSIRMFMTRRYVI